MDVNSAARDSNDDGGIVGMSGGLSSVSRDSAETGAPVNEVLRESGPDEASE